MRPRRSNARQALSGLRLEAQVIDERHRKLLAMVATARKAGCTWQEIADALASRYRPLSHGLPGGASATSVRNYYIGREGIE